METFIYILIGIVSAVLTYSVVYSVIGVVKGNRKQKELEDKIFQMEIDIQNLYRDLNERVDLSEMNFDKKFEDTHRLIGKLENEVFSQLDSRLDKLYDKIKKQIPPTNDDVMMELRKVREDFFALRQNL